MIQIFLLPDSKKPGRVCKPKNLITTLIEDGKLQNFIEVATNELLADEADGNAKSVSVTLLSDLILEDVSKGWSWVKGYIQDSKTGEKVFHNWLECDGWAIDASSRTGLEKVDGKAPVLIVDAEEFIKLNKLRGVQRKNEKQSKKWLMRRADRVKTQYMSQLNM